MFFCHLDIRFSDCHILRLLYILADNMDNINKNDYKSGVSVLFLTETYYPSVGGTPTQTLALAKDLTRNGVRVTVITRRFRAELPRFEYMEGVQVYRTAPFGNGAAKKWLMLFTVLPLMLRLRHHFDVIYVPGFRVLGMLAVVFAALFRKKNNISCG